MQSTTKQLLLNPHRCPLDFTLPRASLQIPSLMLLERHLSRRNFSHPHCFLSSLSRPLRISLLPHCFLSAPTCNKLLFSAFHFPPASCRGSSFSPSHFPLAYSASVSSSTNFLQVSTPSQAFSLIPTTDFFSSSQRGFGLSV